MYVCMYVCMDVCIYACKNSVLNFQYGPQTGILNLIALLEVVFLKVCFSVPMR